MNDYEDDNDWYIVITAGDQSSLAKEVRRMRNIGYKPTGGIAWDSVNGHSNKCYQAMWREPSKEETSGRHL